MSARLGLGVLLALALLWAVPAGTVAAQPQTSLGEVSSEVMCPVCGTLLELAESPQAQRQKAFVARLVAAGRSKEQIKEALVAEYGNEVLALPRGSGFDLSAYLVPVVAFGLALVALALGVRRWRQAGGGGADDPAAGEGPNAADGKRLDEDLARYDL